MQTFSQEWPKSGIRHLQVTERGHTSTPPTDDSDRVKQLKTSHVLPSGEAAMVEVSCKAMTTTKEKNTTLIVSLK